VAIAHQTVPNSNGKFQRENGIRFPILHDEGEICRDDQVCMTLRWSKPDSNSRSHPDGGLG
jgi:hypothetical protein